MIRARAGRPAPASHIADRSVTPSANSGAIDSGTMHNACHHPSPDARFARTSRARMHDILPVQPEEWVGPPPQRTARSLAGASSSWGARRRRLSRAPPAVSRLTCEDGRRATAMMELAQINAPPCARGWRQRAARRVGPVSVPRPDALRRRWRGRSGCRLARRGATQRVDRRCSRPDATCPPGRSSHRPRRGRPSPRPAQW